MHSAKSRAVRWSVTFTCRQDLCASRNTNRFGRAVALIFAIVSLGLTRRRWLADFTNQLCWAFFETKPLTPGIGLFGLKVEELLHTGDISYRSLPECTTSCGATASGRPRPDAGGPSRATALHAPSVGPSDRPADRASSAYGLRVGSSKPWPPTTPR